MGGKTASSRNQYMMKMLDKHFGKAKTSRKGAIAALAGKPPSAESEAPGDVLVAAASSDAKEAVAMAAQAQPMPVVAVGSSSSSSQPPAGSLTEASAGTAAPTMSEAPSPGSVAVSLPDAVAVVSGDGNPDPESSDVGEDEAADGSKSSVAEAGGTLLAYAAPPPAAAVTPTTSDSSGDSKRSSWDIQVGAYPKAKDARRRLDEVRALDVAGLRQKTGHAIPVSKGKSILYRARFLGFSEKAAKETCRQLARRGVSCLTLGPQS
jgi:D-alanyl-D-alanine carboxypeptidase